jgi:hypothetical protein
MIKEQYRSGNLVDFRGQIETVYQIRNSCVDFFRGVTKRGTITQPYGWEAIKPIPLTEDLVKKTNLENNKGEYYFKDTHLYLDFSLGRCMLCHFSGDSFRELKYLHELQNIYFCLMEEELIINL